jgi:hypothetical protein
MVKSPKQTDWEGDVGDSEEDPSAFRQLFRFAISIVAELALSHKCSLRASAASCWMGEGGECVFRGWHGTMGEMLNWAVDESFK